MAIAQGQFLRVLPTVLFCLALTGAAHADGPVVGWGYDVEGQATAPTRSTESAGQQALSRRTRAITSQLPWWSAGTAWSALRRHATTVERTPETAATRPARSSRAGNVRVSLRFAACPSFPPSPSGRRWALRRA
jgi:hypothetical protein